MKGLFRVLAAVMAFVLLAGCSAARSSTQDQEAKRAAEVAKQFAVAAVQDDWAMADTLSTHTRKMLNREEARRSAVRKEIAGGSMALDGEVKIESALYEPPMKAQVTLSYKIKVGTKMEASDTWLYTLYKDADAWRVHDMSVLRHDIKEISQ